MPNLNRLLEKIFFTRKIHTRVPSELVDLDTKVGELLASYKIQESTKRELFHWLYTPSVNLPHFAFPIEVNGVVYTLRGRIDKGRNFDKIVIRLKVNRLLISFYWLALVFVVLCTLLLIQESAGIFIVGLNVFMLLRVVLFFVSCNQELTRIKSRMTGFLVKSNTQQPNMYIKKRA